MPEFTPAQTTVTLTGDDGTKIDVSVTVTAQLTPAPAPDLTPEPPVNPPVAVEIGGTKITVVSPGQVKINTARETNDLVIYTAEAAVAGKTPANRWGKDVAVADGKVVAAAVESPATIPPGGYVLSGHFETGEALAAAAVVGATVAVKDSTGKPVPLSVATAPVPVPVPDPVQPAPTTWPAKMIGAYKKMFSGDPGRLGDYTTAGCNVVFLAFANQSSGRLRLCGHSAQGKASLVADIRAHQATGGKVSVSIGGAGFPISTSNTAGFVADFDGIAADLGVPIDGIDWDLEHDNVTAEIVAISKALKAKYGPNFGVTYSVGGVSGQTAIDNRIATGKALHAAGVLDAYSWQLYDTPVDLGTAKWRLGYCIDRGIPKDKMCVGMMLGSTANYWDNTEARTYMADIKATMGLTRTALWTEGWNGNDTQWARDMRAIIG